MHLPTDLYHRYQPLNPSRLISVCPELSQQSGRQKMRRQQMRVVGERAGGEGGGLRTALTPRLQTQTSTTRLKHLRRFKNKVSKHVNGIQTLPLSLSLHLSLSLYIIYIYILMWQLRLQNHGEQDRGASSCPERCSAAPGGRERGRCCLRLRIPKQGIPSRHTCLCP